jgi:hypothetical protein
MVGPAGRRALIQHTPHRAAAKALLGMAPAGVN